jgi:hypothetical protein
MVFFLNLHILWPEAPKPLKGETSIFKAFGMAQRDLAALHLACVQITSSHFIFHYPSPSSLLTILATHGIQKARSCLMNITLAVALTWGTWLLLDS